MVRAAVVSLFAVAAALGLRAQEQLDFVLSFTDAKGAAVTDVTANELSIVENGVMGTIVSIQPDTHPLDVQLLVDNGTIMGPALAELRVGVKGFFSALPNDAQVSLVTLAPQPRFVLRPVVGPQNGVQAADRLAPDISLAAFLDALVEAGERLRNQAASRPASAQAEGWNGLGAVFVNPSGSRIRPATSRAKDSWATPFNTLSSSAKRLPL